MPSILNKRLLLQNVYNNKLQKEINKIIYIYPPTYVLMRCLIQHRSGLWKMVVLLALIWYTCIIWLYYWLLSGIHVLYGYITGSYLVYMYYMLIIYIICTYV